MGMALEWTKAIQTGDAELDAAHQSLFDLLVQIDGAGEIDKEKLLAAGVLGDLHALLTELFAREEAVMAESGYAQQAVHGEDHGAMLDLVEAAVGRRRADAALLDSIAFTAAGHIETIDVPLAAFLRQQASKRRLPTRRGADVEKMAARTSGARPAAPVKAAFGPSGAKSEDQVKLETLILDTYTQTLLTLKSAKGLTGDRAKAVAYTIVATAVSQATGRPIRPEAVAQLIKGR